MTTKPNNNSRVERSVEDSRWHWPINGGYGLELSELQQSSERSKSVSLDAHNPEKARDGTLYDWVESKVDKLNVSAKSKDTLTVLASTAFAASIISGVAGGFAKLFDESAARELRTAQEAALQDNPHYREGLIAGIDELLEEHYAYVFGAPDEEGLLWLTELAKSEPSGDEITSVLDIAAGYVKTRNYTVYTGGAAIGAVAAIHAIKFNRRRRYRNKAGQSDRVDAANY